MFVQNVPAPVVGPRNVLVQVRHSCVSVGTEMASVGMSGLPLYRHYMVLTFPLMYVWLARLALRPGERGGRAALLALVAAQATISIGFLHYIHVNPRPIRGDYGTPYAAQRQ